MAEWQSGKVRPEAASSHFATSPLCHFATSSKGTLLLIVGITLARLAYLAWLCPYTLIEDETNYWEWSRHLSLSYYTKGPGIAWTIAGFVRLLGENEFAVRAIAAVASGVAAWAVAGLAFDLTRDRRVAWYAAAVFFVMPVFQSLGLITTIDGPYAACWAVAAWAGWRVLRGSGWALVGLGAVIGVGVLYKYTMLMVVPGLALAWWLGRRGKNRSRGEEEWRSMDDGSPLLYSSTPPLLYWLLALAVFAVIVSPIVVWNHEQGWPTVRHLMGHLGLPGGDQYVRQGGGQGWTYKPQWTLNYVGSQLALGGPMLLLALLQRLYTRRARREEPARWAAVRYCLSLSEPMFVLYLLVSLVTNPQGNWAMAAFVTLVPVAAMQVVRLRDGLAGSAARWTRLAWGATLVLGLATGLGMLRIDWLAKVPVVGKYVPVWRVMGADVMASHAQELAEELRAETGREPFVIALHYGRASQFAFYMPGRPTVFCCSSLLLNGRVSPYDFWPDTDLRKRGTVGVEASAEYPSLIGRPAVMNGARFQDWAPLFERVVEIGKLRADGKRDRPAFKGYGFKGFPKGGLRTEGAPPTLDEMLPKGGGK